MKRKAILGTAVLIILSMLPLIPWLLGPVSTYALDYENITHAIGQAAALVGMTMFAITFVLSTRLRIFERMLGGLDKVYVVHSLLGSIAFILLLMHPIFLILKYIPGHIDLAAGYLLPGMGWAVDLGIIALGGMIVLLVLTLYISIRYNYWKLSHKFLGLFFVIAVFHIILIRGTISRDHIFDGYFIYVAIVSAIGIIAFLYSLLYKSTGLAYYRIKSIDKGAKNIYDIVLEPVKKPLQYKAGQFAFFRFKKLGREFHPYSIASATGSGNIRVIVKKLGDYTNRIEELKKGDIAAAEGPYGHFTIQNPDDEMVWIGAGIGITPFMGMAADVMGKKHKGKVSLYYCAKAEDEFMGLDELMEISESKDISFRFVPWCTGKDGKMSLSDIGQVSKKAKYYLCGPLPFKESFISQLKKSGVSRENIFEEDFGLK